MDYVCLRNGCDQEAAVAGICANGHGALVPVRKWSDYSGNQGLVSVTDFSPSTRQVSYDVYVDQANTSVYFLLVVLM